MELLKFAPEPLAQRDLAMIVGIENQIHALRVILEEKCGAALDRLLSGAPVEPGEHSAEVHRSDRHGTRVQSLRVDGRRIK